MHYTMGTASRQGTARAVNQDHVHAELLEPGTALALIADGLGSYSDSAEASHLAAAVALATLKSRPPDRRTLIDAIHAANLELWHQSVDRQTMLKTTLSLLACTEAEALVAHVGDSRVYRLRGGELRALTRDHSLANVSGLQRMARGVFGKQKSSRHVLTRVVGDQPMVQVDALATPVLGGDRFILCSDGVWDMVDDSTMLATANDLETDAIIAQRLVQIAGAQGGDDASAVVLTAHSA